MDGRGSPAGGRALRVMLLIDSLGLGGAERLVVDLARAATSRGHEVSVTSVGLAGDRRNEMIPELEALGIQPSFLEVPRLLSAGAVPRTVRAIRASGCDVVHAHLEYAATLAALAGPLARRPVVCTFHHVPSGEIDRRTSARELLAVAAASRTGRTVFVSQASLDEFARRYGRWARNWTVVRNGIDLDRFTPEPAPPPPDLAWLSGRPVALLPAAMRGGKGHDTAVRAWDKVIASVPDAVLVMAGSGRLEEALRAEVDRRGLAGSVVLAGFRPDMAAMLRSSTVVLLPSEGEALPTALMEAAACGRAVVATSVGGIPEVVADGETGILVPPADPAALADAVISLLRNEAQREAMAAAARRRAEGFFGLDRWVGELEAVYQSCL